MAGFFPFVPDCCRRMVESGPGRHSIPPPRTCVPRCLEATC
jgi:hypothetical protein